MISINIYEIIMQMVNFGILLFLLNKFLFKPLAGYLQKRETIIQGSLEEAEKSRQQSETFLKQQNDLLQQAHQEARDIRESAKKATEQEKDFVLAEARKEAENTLVRAKEEIDRSIEAATKDLTTRIGLMAIGLSEKIIRKNITAKDQESIIKAYLESVKN